MSAVSPQYPISHGKPLAMAYAEWKAWEANRTKAELEKVKQELAKVKLMVDKYKPKPALGFSHYRK